MKDYDIDVIRLIGPIALDAHKLGTGDSIISLPNTVDYSIFKSEAADFKVEEATFSFCSTTARKRMVWT